MNTTRGLVDATLEVWKTFFPGRTIDPASHFFELGGDSILAINMLAALERETGYIIPIGTLYKAPVLSDFANSLQGFTREEKRPIVTPLQAQGLKVPLFAIAPAVGGVFHYREFAGHLPKNQPCYCLEPRISAEGRHSYASVEEIASWNIRAMKDYQVEGPYRLCGFSFGGSIAWEMARQLSAAGEKVELLLSFDTIARGIEFFQLRHEGGPFKRFTHVLSRLFQNRETYRRHGARLHWGNVVSLVGVKFRYLFSKTTARLSRTRRQEGFDAAEIEDRVQNTLRCVYDYGTYEGELILLRARKQLVLRREIDYELGWTGRALKGLRIIDVSGDHLTLMYGEPGRELAAQTVRLLEELPERLANLGESAEAQGELSFPENSITSPVDRFRDMVNHAPERKAILDQGAFYTFRELNEYSDRLCAWILDAGRDAPGGVAVYLENGYAMCAAFLAVLKSGRYYVPLDPEHPEERTSAIVEQARTGLVITDDHLLDRVTGIFASTQASLLSVDRLPDEMGVPESQVAVDPESPAVILFTSGSTGNPKGVLHNHRSVAYVGWRRGVGIDLKPSDRYLSVYSGAFMGFLNGFYASIQFGSCFCFYRLRQRGLEGLAAWLNANRITLFHAVTSVYRNFVTGLPDGMVLGTIRSVTPGGEPSRPSDIEEFKEHFRPGSVYYANLGSSETGSIAFEPIYHDTVVPPRIPVGVPFPELNLWIRDDDGNPCPPKVIGEISLKTHNIFSGYWQDEEKTREVLAPLPDGSLLYRTGDYGLLLEDGRLVNLGRRDNQVKINGYRIEIPDVESSFMQLPQVAEIAVVVREDETANHMLRLYAFYALRPACAHSTKEEIREALLEHLPTPMIPNYLFELESLPKNPTGKVDRKLLLQISRKAPWGNASPLKA